MRNWVRAFVHDTALLGRGRVSLYSSTSCGLSGKGQSRRLSEWTRVIQTGCRPVRYDQAALLTMPVPFRIYVFSPCAGR
jgi:hypothetical protein